MKSSICFHICYPGELAAGMRAFDDEVSIRCDSGNFGGDEDEFADFMKAVLTEWYDGATVTVKQCSPHEPDFYRGSRVRCKSNTQGSRAEERE
jgi:hypothetical protein